MPCSRQIYSQRLMNGWCYSCCRPDSLSQAGDTSPEIAANDATSWSNTFVTYVNQMQNFALLSPGFYLWEYRVCLQMWGGKHPLNALTFEDTPWLCTAGTPLIAGLPSSTSLAHYKIPYSQHVCSKENILFGISVVTSEVSSCTKFQIFRRSAPGTAGELKAPPQIL